jgi:hypothetical protein
MLTLVLYFADTKTKLRTRCQLICTSKVTIGENEIESYCRIEDGVEEHIECREGEILQDWQVFNGDHLAFSSH